MAGPGTSADDLVFGQQYGEIEPVRESSTWRVATFIAVDPTLLAVS
jgi:hypothetical protein